VLRAKDGQTRARRLRTVSRVEREFEAIPIDAEVARIFASIVGDARVAGRRPRVIDVWIAATGVRYGLVVFTERADFTDIPRFRFKGSRLKFSRCVAMFDLIAATCY
jgi:predicted nucleic acid-binding protein